MDDSDVERIVDSIEKEYGKSRAEFAARNKTYRGILLDDYLYGGADKREERLAEGKRIHASAKQDFKIKQGLKAWMRYGRVDAYTLRAIRALMKRGKA